MNFFTSPNDLEKWVKSYKTPDEASLNIMEVVGKNSERDIVETCRSIFEGKDGSASEVLYKILGRYNITREGKNMTNKIIKEAQIIGRDAPLYANMEMKVCPKLPFSVGKRLISTYNCRHQCLDSLVLDDDPNRVYCLEAMWRRHVMDKFSREFKDKDGKWVGGYVNERFQIFTDDGGNQMQLANSEKTRKPRPHQYSTERRLEEARGEKTTDLTASNNKFVKLASVETKENNDEAYKIFDDIVEMKQAGLNDEDIIYKVAEHYNKSILQIAGIHKAATKMLSAHSGIVYSHNRSNIKKADMTTLPIDTGVVKEDQVPVTFLNGEKGSLMMGQQVAKTPQMVAGKAVFSLGDNKEFTLDNKVHENQIEIVDQNHITDISKDMNDSGLTEPMPAKNTAPAQEDFPVEVKE